MRREGDLLLEHVAAARQSVLLCAPFIKIGVIKRLFAAIQADVPIDLYTRWHAEEVAAGVSDLAVFDFVQDRPHTHLYLLDQLHAKLYLTENRALVGSANLTATALGWCTVPNVEILVAVNPNGEEVRRCMTALASARSATSAERLALQAEVDALRRTPLPGAEAVDETMTGIWLPRFGAPDKLYRAYVPESRDRLPLHLVEAAQQDLAALGIDPALTREDFNANVAEQFRSMPAIQNILTLISRDVSDEEGAAIVASLPHDLDMPPEAIWEIIRNWILEFLPNQYEVVPQSFITRLRPGAGR